MRKIGAHVSAAGGVDKAVERGHAIGANCIQVFSGSPRVWQRPNLATINAEKILSKQQELSVSPIFTHALYLINLASDNPELIRKSTEALQFDLRFDAHIHGAGVIVHLGSHQGRGWEAGRDALVKTLTGILEKTPAKSHLLIENAASQNGKVGGDLAEIQWLIEAVRSPRLGWCVDTCHAFTAGYALGAATKATTDSKNVFAEIERLQLADHLHCVHVNDSRDPFASHRDRHANLGDGMISPADLRFFLNQPVIAGLPLILEVPGIDDTGPDAENISRLKKLTMDE